MKESTRGQMEEERIGDDDDTPRSARQRLPKVPHPSGSVISVTDSTSKPECNLGG